MKHEAIPGLQREDILLHTHTQPSVVIAHIEHSQHENRSITELLGSKLASTFHQFIFYNNSNNITVCLQLKMHWVCVKYLLCNLGTKH